MKHLSAGDEGANVDIWGSGKEVVHGTRLLIPESGMCAGATLARTI